MRTSASGLSHGHSKGLGEQRIDKGNANRRMGVRLRILHTGSEDRLATISHIQDGEIRGRTGDIAQTALRRRGQRWPGFKLLWVSAASPSPSPGGTRGSSPDTHWPCSKIRTATTETFTR